MTGRDFLVSAVGPHVGIVHRAADDFVLSYAPGQAAGRNGWWWAITTPSDTWLAGGWSAGSKRELRADMARELELQRRRSAWRSLL